MPGYWFDANIAHDSILPGLSREDPITAGLSFSTPSRAAHLAERDGYVAVIAPRDEQRWFSRLTTKQLRPDIGSGPDIAHHIMLPGLSLEDPITAGLSFGTPSRAARLAERDGYVDVIAPRDEQRCFGCLTTKQLRPDIGSARISHTTSCSFA